MKTKGLNKKIFYLHMCLHNYFDIYANKSINENNSHPNIIYKEYLNSYQYNFSYVTLTEFYHYYSSSYYYNISYLTLLTGDLHTNFVSILQNKYNELHLGFEPRLGIYSDFFIPKLRLSIKYSFLSLQNLNYNFYISIYWSQLFTPTNNLTINNKLLELNSIENYLSNNFQLAFIWQFKNYGFLLSYKENTNFKNFYLEQFNLEYRKKYKNIILGVSLLPTQIKTDTLSLKGIILNFYFGYLIEHKN